MSVKTAWGEPHTTTYPSLVTDPGSEGRDRRDFDGQLAKPAPQARWPGRQVLPKLTLRINEPLYQTRNLALAVVEKVRILGILNRAAGRSNQAHRNRLLRFWDG
jgi:hypothetical protein